MLLQPKIISCPFVDCIFSSLESYFIVVDGSRCMRGEKHGLTPSAPPFAGVPISTGYRFFLYGTDLTLRLTFPKKDTCAPLIAHDCTCAPLKVSKNYLSIHHLHDASELHFSILYNIHPAMRVITASTSSLKQM